MRDQARGTDIVRDSARKIVNIGSAGYVLVFVSDPVTCVAVRVVVSPPVQIGERKGGVNAELEGVGFFRVSRQAATASSLLLSNAAR